MKAREQELEREKSRLANEGRKEQQAKIREMETKLEASSATSNTTRAKP